MLKVTVVCENTVEHENLVGEGPLYIEKTAGKFYLIQGAGQPATTRLLWVLT